MDKIKFPKKTEIISAEELDIMDAPGVVFEFWANPSKPVVNAIYDIVYLTMEKAAAMTVDEISNLNDRYYIALSELIVDCNIAGLDFSTPKAVEKSFDADDVPINFIYRVVVSYLSRLLDLSDAVKKALALRHLASNSGRGSATKEEK
jgi:hypothetical protein